jgi:hypothetical protein
VSAPGTSATPEPARGVRLAVCLAVASALVCSIALGTRTLTSVDLGYHLAYGEQALATRQLVDHNAYLYTLPSQHLSASARRAPGPGSWYDADGRYRFPNANWLSQIAMASVYRWGGVTGLCVLTCGLVLAVALLLLGSSRRLGLPWVVCAAGLLWFGLVGYSRFNLRPELFGYLVFACELAVLGPIVLEPRRAAEMSGRSIAAVVLLHLSFVNLHSYSLLGLLVSGAIFSECLIRSSWQPRADRDSGDLHTWRQARRRSGLLLFSMLAAAFANPWTWRLAILPFETLQYLREHQIGGIPGAHPWSHILEFHQTLHAAFPDRVSDFAIAGLLLLVILGAISAVLRRRWALLIVLTLMGAVALSMKRNVAPAALAVIPLGLAATRVLFDNFATRMAPARRSIVTVGFASLVIASATVFASSIISNRFYLAEGHPMRFGIGISRTHLPIGAARWIDAHLPEARVWCDMASSSTLHFFTEPHREVPILTNTWAYPPAIMAELREVRSMQRPIESLVDDYRADVVVLDYRHSPPLFRALAKHPTWALVHVEGRQVVFARLEGSQAEVVRSQSLAALENLEAFVRRQRQSDPALESALLHPGIVYLNAGLGELAVETFGAIVRERPSWSVAWNYLGLGYLTRAREERVDELAVFEAALHAFGEALRHDPSNEIALRNLEMLSHSDDRSRLRDDEPSGRDSM